jgi:uncharacterized protein (TIGR03083 family)
MLTDQDYLEHLRRESARFADALRATAPDAAVPSCPEWTADDLLWHLCWVQLWWATVVRDDVTGDAARAMLPERPADHAALLTLYADAAGQLGAELAGRPGDDTVWTWSSDRTVRFVLRRQAHEALIHRVDAELASGDRTPMDRSLCADGVEEALRVMYAFVPDWATITQEPGRTIRFSATDTGDTWLVTLGRFTGTDPDGTRHDEPDIVTAATDPGGPVAAEIRGTAADLDCWLWHRPTVGDLEREGDQDVVATFEAVISPGLT